MRWKLNDFCKTEIVPRKTSARLTGWHPWTDEEVAELGAGKGHYGFYPRFARKTGRSLRSVKGKAREL